MKPTTTRPSSTRRGILRRRAGHGFALALFCAGASGCAGPPGGPATHIDRLIAQYPDLANGRFEIVADFEQVEQMELVHTAGAAACSATLSLDGGVRATGARCLRAVLTAADDAVVLNNSSADHWLLKRDWRPYDLLLASIHCPVDEITLDVTLVTGPSATPGAADVAAGGRARPAVQAAARMLLKAGWNVLRLDLAEAGEHLALDDVRELRWSLPKIERGVELQIDDVIVASNRKDLLGSSANTAGELYIQRQGRRWNIGAGGRFELGFAQGEIVAWFDLSNDPHRLRNLLGGAALGPLPIVLPESHDGDIRAIRQFMDLGESVMARQRVMEMSPVRVVLEADWRFVPAGSTPTPQTPYHRWSYCIYPSGHVYVGLDCTTQAGDWSAEELGLALTTGDIPDANVYLHSTAQLDDPDELRQTSFAALSPGGTDRPGLLFVPAGGRTAPQLTAIHNAAARQLHVVMSGGEVHRPVQSWSFLLSVWPPGNTRPEQRAVRAVAYAGARVGGAIDVAVGSAVTNRPGDAEHDGFDERHGCFVVAPDRNQLRVFVDARKTPLDSPVFCVTGVANRQAAVYVDQIILDPRQTTADDDGDLIFQIPTTLNRRHLVEVYLRAAAPPK